MSDNRPTYGRRSTKPLPRVELAPISRQEFPEERGYDPDAETMMGCPCCKSRGLITAVRYAKLREDYPELFATDVVAVEEP